MKPASRGRCMTSNQVDEHFAGHMKRSAVQKGGGGVWIRPVNVPCGSFPRALDRFRKPFVHSAQCSALNVRFPSRSR